MKTAKSPFLNRHSLSSKINSYFFKSMLHSNDRDLYEFVNQLHLYVDYPQESEVDLGEFVVHLHEFMNYPKVLGINLQG